MKNTFFRVAALSLAIVGFATPSLAADTYQWTDISSQLNERTNRPVWAMAYASPYWYMTDGQELWSGGHVWRSEGSIVSDITTEVRNAGLSRVDDIVSDGSSILYLKNVTPRNNGFEMLLFQNGQYKYPASSIRNYMSSNEGIVTIAGSEGTWGITTTFGRMFLYTPSTGKFTLLQENKTGSSINYINTNAPYVPNNHSAPIGETLTIGLQPDSTGWILFYKTVDGRLTMRVMNKDGYVTGAGPLTYDRMTMFASNGQYVFHSYSENGTNRARIDSGTTAIYVSNLPGSLDGTTVAWDGTNPSGIFVKGKNVYTLSNGTMNALDQTRDYFITGAGNGNGTILLGGAVSETWTSQPTSPLTAKLVKLTRNTSGSTGGTTTSGNTTYSTWFSPYSNTIKRNETTTFYVNSWNPNGIRRVEIYVNGSLRQTCDVNTTANQNCTVTIYGWDYTNGQQLSVNARITASNGAENWTSIQYLTVSDSGSTSGSPTTSDISAWVSVDPTGSVLDRNSSKTLRANGSASEGLQRLDVYVNDSVVRTCSFSRSYGSQNCDYTLNGWNYSENTTLRLKARAMDWYGREAWSDVREQTVQTTNGQNTNTNGSNWNWMNPEKTELQPTESATYNVGAWDPEGLRSIEIYANGSLVRTCTFSGETSSRECAYTIPTYSNDTTLNLNAKITDWNWNTSWTNSRSVKRLGQTAQNQSGTVSVSANRTSYSSTDYVTYTAYASDPNGIARIDILVNAVRVKVCYGTSTCSYTGGPYGTRSSVTYAATVWDKLNNPTTTGYKSLNHK
jgi:hypothetical protein